MLRNGGITSDSIMIANMRKKVHRTNKKKRQCWKSNKIVPENILGGAHEREPVEANLEELLGDGSGGLHLDDGRVLDDGHLRSIGSKPCIDVIEHLC